MKQKSIKLILSILTIVVLIIVLIILGLKALKNRNNINGGVNSNIDTNFIGAIYDKVDVEVKTKEINTKIAYVDDYLSAPYIDIEITNNDVHSQKCSVYLNILDISPELISDNFKYIIARSINDEKFLNIANSNGSAVSQSKQISMISEEIPTNQKYTYRIYLYLGKKLNGEYTFNGKAEVKFPYLKREISADDNACVNSIVTPIISDGLIPVVISDNGTVKTIKSTDSNWYDYCNKKWANAILVKKSSRKKYLDKNDVKVNATDILAYFVWIPRYSYKIWTDTVSGAYDEDTISVKFINKNQIDSGEKIGEWYTHPAFTFDNKELSGIWVSKFELSGTLDKPLILPNASSLVNKSIGEYFKSSLLFSGGKIKNNKVEYNGSKIYGLSKNINSHLIKNSEWGAVAYLSHSKYGINDKIRINNYIKSNKYLTGCGSLVNNYNSSNNCDIVYGKSKEYPQSTTGNITGIFDMSGGTIEYVMTYNNKKINSKSQFTQEWFNTPSNYKYYDLYEIDNIQACTIKSCGGHALYETNNWYLSLAIFLNDDFSFMRRGCGYLSGLLSSQFCYSSGNGEGGEGTSSRVTLITE